MFTPVRSSMAFEVPKTPYSGKIREITLGKGDNAVTVGGETAYPFYFFEGRMPHVPRIAMEICDTKPSGWPAATIEPFKDVLNDPVAWAKKCVNIYGAEMICLQMISTDPDGLNRPAADAATIVRKVAEAVDVPLIVWGTGNHDKDTEVLKAAAEICKDKNLILGPVEEADHKTIGAAAIGFKHTVAASTPVDINLAKQLNILLGNLGVPDTSLLMDTSVSSIGYGLEYCYSVMERTRMAALTQQDGKLQYPIICNMGKEVWKTKEAVVTEKQDPRMGDADKRGILLEAMTATLLLIAGADILIMRHPEAVKQVKELIGEMAG
jgi:acetyl-CoA decarbonylase/synthase, CODH/ACS complex subunit delta